MQPVSEATVYVIFSGKHPVRNDGTREANGPLKGRLPRGVFVAFPGQIQPAYALAYILRRSLPHLHITVGGPAMTQILKRLTPDVLVLSIEKGKQPSGVIRGKIRMKWICSGRASF